jgi:hypothetical protein
MYDHIKRFTGWVLPLHTYEDQPTLLAELDEKVIGPAEARAKAIIASS